MDLWVRSYSEWYLTSDMDRGISLEVAEVDVGPGLAEDLGCLQVPAGAAEM